MIFKNLIKKLKDKNGDFDDGEEINKESQSRNQSISSFLILLIISVAVGGYMLSTKKSTVNNSNLEKPIDFGAVVEDDFIDADNQSALTVQQNLLDDYKAVQEKFRKKIERMEASQDTLIEKQEREMKFFTEKMEAKFKKREAELIKELKANNEAAEVENVTVFGDKKLPPKANIDIDKVQEKDFTYSSTDKSLFNTKGMDSYTFDWSVSEEKKPFKRTVENYVPSGTFVTALVTGGADANAGVLGQGDTVPMVFQTINNGILPNGEESKLNDCTVIGAVYGEISSSRGIVRTNRMSCVLEDGEIIDLPVQGTVFNYGRNGIRGNTLLRNGSVVGMAGLAGVLEGLGNTASDLSTTLTQTALGTTSSVNTEDTLLSALANGGSSVGSTLSKYYIQLAELYHPIVELNQGNIVNIVFLNGFPLDSEEISRIEASKKEEENTGGNNQLLNVIQNNPLANSLPNGVKDAVSSQAQVSPFGNQ